MKWLGIICFAIFSLSTFIVNAQKKRIEGISYLDGNPIAIEIKNGNISKVERIKELSDKNNTLFISPGLIDNQINGFIGVSFAFGGSKLTKSDIEEVTRELWKYGVTSYLPTLTSNGTKVLLDNFKILGEVASTSGMLGSIPGFHLEGPYINPEDGFRGAHPKQHVRLPDWNEFLKLYDASGEKIIQVTVAPDMPGMQDFIIRCTELGVIVAVGHHNANAEQLNLAVKNGAKIATHLGNGCANMINRHRNPLWPQLANDDLMASIICDGFHLLPEEIKTFYKVKGAEKIVLTSDVTSYAGLPPGEYVTLSGDTIELTSKGKLQFPKEEILYGSASPISIGISHIMNVTGCSLSDAIKMASTNPAKLYGLTDRGLIEEGRRADIILFSMDDYEMQIEKTFVKGQLVYQRSTK